MSDWIENEVKGAKQFMQQLIQANTALRAENEKLRAALEFLTSYDKPIPPDDYPDNYPIDFFTLGDLRAAAAALKEKGDANT